MFSAGTAGGKVRTGLHLDGGGSHPTTGDYENPADQLQDCEAQKQNSNDNDIRFHSD